MHPAHALDWNLVHYFDAVVEAGSLAAAAEQLGVSHPTVTRRINALEEALNVPLFDRTSTGLTINPAGRRLVPVARAMREQALKFIALTEQVTQPVRSTVRVTASEYLSPLLPDLLDGLRRDTDLTVELIPSDKDLNLLNRDADIALRHGPPHQLDLVRRQLGLLPLGLWASTGYVEQFGAPHASDSTRHRYVVDAEGRIVKRARQLGFPITDEQISMRCSSRQSELSAMAAGWGIGVMPELTAGGHPHLTRVLTDVDIPPLPVWIIARAELRGTPAGRRVFDALSENLAPHLHAI